MKVRYVGPHLSVQIVKTGQWVDRGGDVDVPMKLGRALCEQADWIPTPIEKKETHDG